MTTSTFLNLGGAVAVIPVHMLASFNLIVSATAGEIVFGSSFSPEFTLRATGTGITQDGDGNITGGTVTFLQFETGGLKQLEIGGFAPLAATAAAAAFTGGSVPGYDQMIALLADATAVTGSAVNDWIDTGAGDDTVDAGGGNDRVSKFLAGDLDYDGGDGSDTLNLGAENGLIYPTPYIAKLVVNLTTGTGISPYGGRFTLTDVENIIGTGTADRLTGNGADNTFGDGMFDRGADLIAGRGGDDTVKMSIQESGVSADGGAGSDTIWISTYGGQAGNNILDFENAAANTGVFARNTFTGFENVTFYEREPEVALEFHGNNGRNQAVGGEGDDLLDGRGGADILWGGLGDDTFLVESAGDLAYEYYDQGNDTVRATVSFTLGYAVERLILLGTANLAGTGNFQDNVIRGNAGNNLLTGGQGADQLFGGAGADVFNYDYSWETGTTAGSLDAIRDFEAGDRIRLRSIDANWLADGDQKFRLDGNGDFAAGEIRITGQTGRLLVELNLDGTAEPEMSFYVYGPASLAAADFIL